MILDSDEYVLLQLELTAALIAGGEPTAIENAAAAHAAAARDARLSGCEIPAAWLTQRLGLSPREERVLWILIAHELCPDVRQRLRALATEAVTDVTFDTLRRLVYGPQPSLATWRELGPQARLRELVLIERTDTGDAPEHRHTFRVAPRVLALVHGELALDPELDGIGALASRSAALGDLEVDPSCPDRVRSAMAGDGLVVLHGRPGSGRRSLLTAVSRETGRYVLLVDARALSTDRGALRRQLQIIDRESRLLARVPLVQHLETLARSGELPDRIDLVESELHGLVLATSTRAIARRWRDPPASVELPQQTGAQRAKLWARALPDASEADADLLATMYPLAPAVIDAAGTIARRVCGEAVMTPSHVEAGIRAVLDDQLAGLANRISSTQSWDDLVLPEDQMTAMIELLARIRERRRVYDDWGFAAKLGRGLGVSALFSGPPGTGKTMAAGLIARELGVDVYQVDLSKIVSKWIGETEKNLSALFDAAEAGHAILLFDEADALFAKRTNVQSSNDRHANQESNYLLQRIESFAGICILTTNHETAIDPAFRRRFSVHVRFPMPDADEREQLWRVMLPTAAPVAEGVRFERLADSFAMSGGYIRNAVLRAAFLAADEDAAISPSHLDRAARLEYEAIGKVVAA